MLRQHATQTRQTSSSVAIDTHTLHSQSRLKERRNSSKSGTHLRQTGGFCACILQVQADAMPASGGRLIQHPQGEYARRLLAVSNLPTSRRRWRRFLGCSRRALPCLPHHPCRHLCRLICCQLPLTACGGIWAMCCAGSTRARLLSRRAPIPRIR
ncbi:hypothetical protein XACM_0573 [Xanthomonas euvesicatoria pv. citrumelo F1]|nr:hypothetical protein XACM_0573 [Xanthomonas euvesicatoria pv. citrumelo F1]